jgi:hypothetical protein
VGLSTEHLGPGVERTRGSTPSPARSPARPGNESVGLI